MRGAVALTGVIVAGVLPASAMGAPTPVSPVNGASVGPNIHPTFQWALPPGERSSLLTVARKPDVTPQGRFFTENVETTKALDQAQTQYTSEQPIPAGTHWWIVRSYRTGRFAEYASRPTPFTITPVLRRPRVRITRYRFTRKLGVDVRITGNVSSARVSVRAYRGRRRVGRKSQTVRFIDPSGVRPRLQFLLVKIRGRRARRLKVVTTVRSGSARVKRTKRVRGV